MVTSRRLSGILEFNPDLSDAGARPCFLDLIMKREEDYPGASRDGPCPGVP